MARNPNGHVNARRFKVREIVWCDFPGANSAFHPEFRDRHPAIIVSTHNRINWPLTVIPVTSQTQDAADLCCIELHKNYWKTDKTASWAVCSHLYSVSHLRLSRPFDYPKLLTVSDFSRVAEACCRRLPFHDRLQPVVN